MSNMYAIKTSTLTALGDAVRSKTSEMRTEIVDDVYVLEGTFTDTKMTNIIYLQLKQPYDTVGVKLVECNGSLPRFNMSSSTWANDIILKVGEEYIYTGGIDIRNGQYCFSLQGGLQYGYLNQPSTYKVEVIPYSEDVAITKEIEVFNTMTPLQMAEEINNMPLSPTAEDLTITGNCNYRFYQGGWDWFIKKFGDEIITENIESCSSMFYGCKTDILFDINAKPSAPLNMSNMFNNYTGTVVPKILGATFGQADGLFTSSKIVEIPNDYFDSWDFSYVDSLTSAYAGQMNNTFNNCYCLRKTPLTMFEHGNPVASPSYSVLNGTFYCCYVLDEIIGMPYPHINGTYNQSGYSGVISSNFVELTSRLKNFTFKEMPAVKWANQTLDLSKYSGWAQYPGRITDNGITTDKQVKDDATYQALKDDPDWWSADVAYSRFNHDSAVRTINSLPSAIEYQTANGQKANIIKFKGEAGSKTDGGAINTLTDEEIAVATAKGWTVSLV